MENTNFDNKSAISGADYLFGGRKAKARKAERKIVKAEKALEKGNVRKAERKLTKAVKKTSKAGEDKRPGLVAKISETTGKVQARKQSLSDAKAAIGAPTVGAAPVTTNGVAMLPIEPVAQESQNAPDLSGMMGNVAAPISGGGGGSIEAPEAMPLDEVQDDWNEASRTDEEEQGEGAAGSSGPIKFWIVAIIVIAAGFLIFKK